MAYKQVMTAKAAVELLMHIAKDLPTGYKDHWPRNLGYWDGEKFTWDCWNLWPKSIVWGWKENRTVGYYAKYNPETGLGDWTGAQIMARCENVSADFEKLTPAEFLLSTDEGHAGAYIGEYIINGRCVNVAECTSDWRRGVQLSYCSGTGGRYQYKGGPKTRTSWGKHGQLPWIDYTVQPEPPEPPTPPEPEEPVYYTVIRGDNLTHLAAKFNTTVAQLVAWNHIPNPNLIFVGQRLIVGKKKPEPPAPEVYYTVRRGDTLSRIAAKYNTTVSQLVSWNHIQNPNLIITGQVLRVK